MNKSDIFAEATHRIVSNNWDLPVSPQKHVMSRRYQGPCLEVRERIKDAGRAAQQSDEIREVLIGYILESYGHFYRSEESTFNQNRKHPEFEEYLTHWFYSAPEYVDVPARGYFRKWFTRPDVLRIESGNTFWRYRPLKGTTGSRKAPGR